MLRNYVKIAVRSILRSKAYSVINISGLSLGIACCLLLYLYVEDEVSYDKHRPRLNDLYRIDTRFGSMGLEKTPSISPPILGALVDEVPEIESGARVLNPPGVAQNLIKIKDQVFYETDGFIADSTVFDVLGFELNEGDAKTALTDANTVVISETMARKIFGKESALDQDITISQGGDERLYKITGVLRDDQQSFIKPHFMTSMMSEGWGSYIRTNPDAAGEWAGQNFIPAYIKLVPGSSVSDTEKKINDVLNRHGAEALKALGMKKSLFLEPVRDIYLRSAVDTSQRISWIYIIISIAAFILVIACINFMNLSTAKSARRATEIGMRKVMGAFRSSLAKQILGEAMIMVILSIVIGVVLVQGTLPWFNQLTGKTISINAQNIAYLGGMLAILTVITGLIAGSYPAFYISSFMPSQVLKGKFTAGNASGKLRQVLVIFQFVVGIVLVCGMIVISRQISYMKSKDLGFSSSAKIVLPLRTQAASSAYPTLKRELQRNSAVSGVSAANYIPGSNVLSDMTFYSNGKSMEQGVNMKRNRVDEDFISQMDIKLLAGRHFTSNFKLESNGKSILNETAVKKLGFTPEEAIGQPLYFEWQGKKYTFEIIGVVRDFNQSSLKEPIHALTFQMPDTLTDFSFAVVSINTDKFKETISSIEKTWKAQVGDTPFEYSFLDESIQKQYDEDRKAAAIINAFAAIAIFICMLGLYGLSSFMAERRIKEIGVRKVMGAGVHQIVGMMSAEFVHLIVIAFVIAVPIAWYGTHKWLEGFEYQTSVGALVFISAGGGALVIALLTVSYESFKAATVNPIQSLRNE